MKCAWPPCPNELVPPRKLRKGRRAPQFCGPACAGRSNLSKVTPEQRYAGAREGAATMRILARTKIEERYATKSDAFKGGFQGGYKARVRYEKTAGMLSESEIVARMNATHPGASWHFVTHPTVGRVLVSVPENDVAPFADLPQTPARDRALERWSRA